MTQQTEKRHAAKQNYMQSLDTVTKDCTPTNEKAHFNFHTYYAKPKKSSARLREVAKAQQTIIAEWRAPRQHKNSFQQMHERKQQTTTKVKIPLVILPVRVLSQFAKQKRFPFSQSVSQQVVCHRWHVGHLTLSYLSCFVPGEPSYKIPGVKEYTLR